MTNVRDGGGEGVGPRQRIEIADGHLLSLVNLLDDLAVLLDRTAKPPYTRDFAADSANQVRDLRRALQSERQLPPGGPGAFEWLSTLCTVLNNLPLIQINRDRAIGESAG
jgi:hypothetical protein